MDISMLRDLIIPKHRKTLKILKNPVNIYERKNSSRIKINPYGLLNLSFIFFI